MKKNFIHKTQPAEFAAKISIVVVFIVFVTYVLYNSMLEGLFILILVPIIFYKSGVLFADEKYMPYKSILGYKVGREKPLPTILYVLIKPTRFENNDLGEEGGYDECYEVALVCEHRTKIILLYTDNPNEAIRRTQIAVEYFKCELRDMTRDQLMKTPEANW